MLFNNPHASRSTLAAALLLGCFAAGCGNSNNSSPASPSPTNPEGTNPPNLLTVTIKNGVFSPNPVIVKVGQTVNWLNSDTIVHSAVNPGVFDIGNIAPTSAHSDNGDGVTFNNAGTFNYHCGVHPNETGSVVVTR